uniref:(northern house mosquito) hypothetical protein n=1 Tax=Culex pipiens TaxID=7175 RepID=A0A8D8B0G3_CULPI
MANPNRCGTRSSVLFPAASRWRRQQRSSRICDGDPATGQRTFLSPSAEAVWELAVWPNAFVKLVGAEGRSTGRDDQHLWPRKTSASQCTGGCGLVRSWTGS